MLRLWGFLGFIIWRNKVNMLAALSCLLGVRAVGRLPRGTLLWNCSSPHQYFPFLSSSWIFSYTPLADWPQLMLLCRARGCEGPPWSLTVTVHTDVPEAHKAHAHLCPDQGRPLGCTDAECPHCLWALRIVLLGEWWDICGSPKSVVTQKGQATVTEFH